MGERWKSGSHSRKTSITFDARSEKDLIVNFSVFWEHQAVSDNSAIIMDSFEVSDFFYDAILLLQSAQKFNQEKYV